MKRSLLCALVLAAGLHQGTVPARAVAPDALRFFKNYFVTGDYVVSGVGLRGKGINGFATGEIGIGTRLDPATGKWVDDLTTRVPDGTDVVAAYLYWQVVTKDTLGTDSGSAGVTFGGKPLSALVPDSTGALVARPTAKVLGSGSPPCWSSGGTTGTSGGTKLTYTYRVDVLRYFEINPDSGKPIVNGRHLVSLPDSGASGNSLPIALGASLVLVYRSPAANAPLRSIVIYDGGFTLDNTTREMRQGISGFYGSADGIGKLTHIVGSGQANKSETLLFNDGVIATNPFGGYAGASWDNPTFTNLQFVKTAMDVTTGVTPSADCLTWGATIFSTAAPDRDGDGLLDSWETTSGLLDPNGQPLPDLKAMKADPDVKDLFVEIGYMETTADDVKYGGVPKPKHSHLPKPEAIKLMGDAFLNAPAPIKLHVDAGPSYDAGNEAGDYVVRGAFARGGEAIVEGAQDCVRKAGEPPWRCQFSDYPGTVGWKTGFRFFRDQVIGGEPSPSPDADDPCDLPGNDGPGQACERRFDRNRRAMFHYALFAHSAGLPKSDLPCLDKLLVDGGKPVADVNGACAVTENPLFREPRTVTGVGDFPGGDVLITLGAFNDVDGAPVGTAFMQASTLMHELGHNLERRHGGEALEPNCKPTYLSVMNYLYQLRGLLDDKGKPNLDFSRRAFAAVDESGLADGPLSDAPLPYRIGWYAPKQGSYLETRGTAATKHCDGSELRRDSLGNLVEPPMVRIDARSTAADIDWNANGKTDETGLALDVNFNGFANTGTFALRGSDDWSNIRLNQVGARRSIGGFYLDEKSALAMGPLSLDTGRSDYGRSDYGRSDYGRSDYGRSDYGDALGRSDYGRSDYGRSDYGRSDYGRSDYGRGDEGRGDFGGGDLFLGDPAIPQGELDFETATLLAKTPPNEYRACVIGVDAGCACPTTSCVLNQVRSDFTASNIGGVQSYATYCVAGTEIVADTPATPWIPTGTSTTVPGQVDYVLLSAGTLRRGAYTCFSTATYDDGVVSDPSNLQPVVAVNVPPIADAKSVVTNEDTPVAVTLSGSDLDGDSIQSYAIKSGPAFGVLSGTGSQVTYTPKADYSGPDSFTYTVSDGTAESAAATVSIEVTPVNDPPVAVAAGVSTPEDVSLSIALSATDVDSATLSYTIVSGPTRGTVSLNGAAATYMPQPNYNGQDGFTFKVSDGQFESTATIAITVTPVDDAPVLTPDSYSTPQGTTLQVAAPGVLANDSDVDNVLIPAVQTGPSHGTVSLGSDGGFTYVPSPDFLGTDSFTYTVSYGLTDGPTFGPVVVNIVVKSYTFYGLQNAPPAPIAKSFKAGSAIPMKWQYKDGALVVNSSAVGHTVTLVGPKSLTISNTDPGSSSFRYDASTNTWYFNLQTKDPSGVSYPTGTYSVTITPTVRGYSPSPTFQIQLVK